MVQYTAYFNGKWVPRDQVKIDVMDRGFMVGDTVFDVVRTYNGKSWRMKEHIDRLFRSLKTVRIDPGLSPQEITDLSEEAIQRNEDRRAGIGDYAVRQFVTRGPGRWTHSAGPASVGILVSPVDFGRFARYYQTGAHVVIPRTRSYPPDALDSKIKHYSRMNFNMAELEANDVDPGAWPVLTDRDGNLTEGTGNNVFLVTKGVIRTPGDRNVLQGISRGTVLDLARQLDIRVAEEELQPYDLYNADEAFICSASMCVLPVTYADRRTLGNGKPGPVTKQLLAAWSEAVGLDIVDQALQFDRG